MVAGLGVCPTAVTADAGYAYAKVYAAFERRGIDAVIPAKAEPIRSPFVPMRRFRYDASADVAGRSATRRAYPASQAASEIRPLLLLQSQGVCALSTQGRLPIKEPFLQQSRRGR